MDTVGVEPTTLRIHGCEAYALPTVPRALKSLILRELEKPRESFDRWEKG